MEYIETHAEYGIGQDNNAWGDGISFIRKILPPVYEDLEFMYVVMEFCAGGEL